MSTWPSRRCSLLTLRYIFEWYTYNLFLLNNLILYYFITQALIPRHIFREKYFARTKISSEIKIKKSSTLFASLFIWRKNVNKDIVIRHVVYLFFCIVSSFNFFCIPIGFAFQFRQRSEIFREKKYKLLLRMLCNISPFRLKNNPWNQKIKNALWITQIIF